MTQNDLNLFENEMLFKNQLILLTIKIHMKVHFQVTLYSIN